MQYPLRYMQVSKEDFSMTIQGQWSSIECTHCCINSLIANTKIYRLWLSKSNEDAQICCILPTIILNHRICTRIKFQRSNSPIQTAIQATISRIYILRKNLKPKSTISNPKNWMARKCFPKATAWSKGQKKTDLLHNLRTRSTEKLPPELLRRWAAEEAVEVGEGLGFVEESLMLEFTERGLSALEEALGVVPFL